MIVSLGTLSGTVGEVTLTVALRGQPEAAGRGARGPAGRRPLRRAGGRPRAWRRRSSTPTCRPGIRRARRTTTATADLHLDVPAGMMAVSGGQQTSLRTEAGRTRVEYRQDLPGKYITVAVGRLVEAGRRVERRRDPRRLGRPSPACVGGRAHDGGGRDPQVLRERVRALPVSFAQPRPGGVDRARRAQSGRG